MSNLYSKIATAIGLKNRVTKPSVDASKPLTAFERVLYASKTNNIMLPVWEQLVNTQFYVIVERLDCGPKTKDFHFSVFSNPVDGLPYVQVAEKVHRLENVSSGNAIRMPGGQLLSLLNAELGMIVRLETDAFVIPKDTLNWLRESTQSAA